MCIDKLTRGSHTRIHHSHRNRHAMEIGCHAGREKAIFGIRGSVLEGTKVIFTLEIFFFTTVATIGAFRSIATIVCTTMSIEKLLVHVRNTPDQPRAKKAVLCCGMVGIENQMFNILC